MPVDDDLKHLAARLDRVEGMVEEIHKFVTTMQEEWPAHLGDCMRLATVIEGGREHHELIGLATVAIGRSIMDHTHQYHHDDELREMIERLEAKVARHHPEPGRTFDPDS